MKKKSIMVMVGIIAVVTVCIVAVVISNGQGPSVEHVIVGIQGSVEDKILANSVWYFSTIVNVNATSCFFQYCNITDSRLIHCLLWNCTLSNVKTENCTILG